ncbi:hypothetical protein EW145_g1515 [Phellinidium pouzarii]|uniref:Uncharacterized protein n=1 Tax=Phellinidium pouzarii TaxID=167371 RepID=A0A4S4LES2_9AGAM|nr:hypothetical protein EW145_g1515 [Phellinidium pouzarii]
MFAKLSNTYSRLTDLRWNVVSESRDEVIPMSSQDNLLPPDVQVLSQLSLAVPGIAMEAMAGVCGKVFSPLCHYAHASLSADVENIVLSLHEADSSFVYRDTYPNDEVDDIYAIPFPLGRIREATEMSSRCPPKTCSDRDEYIASLLQFSTIPSIVITPAPSQSRGMSCVPVQDTYFGARLTVPSYSALNAAHPPMMAPSYLHTPVGRARAERLILPLDQHTPTGDAEKNSCARALAIAIASPELKR